MKKVKELLKSSFDKGVEWDKKILEDREENLIYLHTRVSVLTLHIGFVIGAILL